ncbi:CAP-associated domain-containing protein [Solibacillus daqui]|uniref:CAP-associated domain-containing protein n=1 Tax=Solibacillus daqui TaxID=2912187 RepID=UPI0023673523|nr:CAP-associated domain-containing protein [Solibacillus daqui]
MKKTSFMMSIIIPIIFSTRLLGTNTTESTQWKSYSNIAINKKWTFTFKKNIDANSIANNVYLEDANNKRIAIITTIFGRELTVQPATELNYSASYKIVVTNNLKSTNGNAMNQEIIIPFTTVKKAASDSAVKTFASEYDLQWNMPSSDYKQFHLIGTKNGATVGGYETRANQTVFEIKVGDTRDSVKAKYGDPLTSISKNNTKYTQNYKAKYGQETSGTYFIDNQYVTFFYDAHKNNVIRSVSWISAATEMSKLGFFATQSQELRDGFENLMIELINQARVAEGLKPLTYIPTYNSVARKHSTSMADNNYFSHSDLNGLRGGDRMKQGGITFDWWGENLAYCQYSAIHAHEALMNSLGHRENILRKEFTHVFVGVDFNSKNQPYFTINFYSL